MIKQNVQANLMPSLSACVQRILLSLWKNPAQVVLRHRWRLTIQCWLLMLGLMA